MVTFRHVLHHLVSDSSSHTLSVQRHGLSQMLRMLRPGGHLVFQEQVHQVKLFSRAVYHLSRLASRYRLRMRFFEAGRVVVSFMTVEEVDKALQSLSDRDALEVVDSCYRPRSVQLRWKLTLLMANVGDAFYVIRKGRGDS